MRIKSELWVKAYLRRMTGAGSFATVIKRGDEDFGAIVVLLRRLDGTATVFGPAPRPVHAGDEVADNERRFVRLHKGDAVGEADADAVIARQRDFDADIWVIEVESRAGEHGLDLAREAS